MTKLEETDKLIKVYEDNNMCILHCNDKTLFDIAKSLAIIADKLCEVENELHKEG